MEDKYYQVLEPEERKELLYEEMSSGETEQLKLKQQLFDIRYKKIKNKDEYADRFLDLWVRLLIISQDAPGMFRIKNVKKEIQKVIIELGIVEFKGQGEEAKRILYDEMLHLVKTFISTCETDRGYSHYIFGFVSLKKDQLLTKISTDIQAAGIDVPESLGFKDELSELMLAARSCLGDINELI